MRNISRHVMKIFRSLPGDRFRFGFSIFILTFVALVAVPDASAKNEKSSIKTEKSEELFLREAPYAPKFLTDLFFHKPKPAGIVIALDKLEFDADLLSIVSAPEADTTNGENRILSLREGEGAYYLYLQIKDKDRRIKIEVYNMLAKKVLDVYEGKPFPSSDMPYEIRTATLPNGMYICIVQGEGFRLNEKFIISR